MQESLSIVGMGAVTAVATHAALNTAAVHAGVSRLTLFSMPDEQLCHLASVGALEDELPRPERLDALLRGALDQCTAVLGAERAACLPRIPLFVAAPQDAALAENLVFGPQRERARWERVTRLEPGHAAVVGALGQVYEALDTSPMGLACVAGVDVRCDPASLEDLARRELLLVEDNPWGIAPGEGAGALLLATPDARRRFSLRSLCRIRGYGATVESAYSRNVPCIGTALSAACHEALTTLQGSEQVGVVVCDLTPERARCDEWGFTAPRIARLCRDVSSFAAPSRQWGDVGSATGPLLVQLAASALMRDDPDAQLALVWSASEAGQRAALVLERESAMLADPRVPAECLPLSHHASSQDESTIADLLDEASFLFELRCSYLDSLELSPDSEVYGAALASIEDRLQVQIDALRAAGKPARLRCLESMEGPGDCYAAARLMLAEAPDELMGYLMGISSPDAAQSWALRAAMAHGAMHAGAGLIDGLLKGSPFLVGLGLLLAAESNHPIDADFTALALGGAERLGPGLPLALAKSGRASEARELLNEWLASAEPRLARAAAFALLRLDGSAAYPRLWSWRDRPAMWLPLVVGNQKSQLSALETLLARAEDVQHAFAALALLGSRTAVRHILERFDADPHAAALALHIVSGIELFETVENVSVVPDDALTHPELLARRRGDQEVGVETAQVRRLCIERDVWKAALGKLEDGFLAGERYRLGAPFTQQQVGRSANHPLLAPTIRMACAEELAIIFKRKLPMRSDPLLRERGLEIASAAE